MGSDTQVRRREDTGRTPSLPCPSCNGNLFVTCTQAGFHLLCACGRRIAPADVAEAAPPGELTAGLDVLREQWEDRLAALRRISMSAMALNQPQVAMVLDRHILNLAARVELLRHLRRGA